MVGDGAGATAKETTGVAAQRGNATTALHARCYGRTRDSTKNLFVALLLEAQTTFRVLLACLT